MLRYLVTGLFVLAGVAQHIDADEPAKDNPKEEKQFTAPSPRPIPSDYLPYQIPNSLPKPGTREVWQYYGVDNRGRWLPRVIQAPYGSYYLYNGAPFLFTTTQPHLYMPYVID